MEKQANRGHWCTFHQLVPDCDGKSRRTDSGIDTMQPVKAKKRIVSIGPNRKCQFPQTLWSANVTGVRPEKCSQ